MLTAIYIIVNAIIKTDNSIALPSANRTLIPSEIKYSDLIILLCLLVVTKLMSPNENRAIIKFIIVFSSVLKILKIIK